MPEELKRELEEAKLENGESLDKVREWGQEIEERIESLDNEIKVLETRVKSAIAEAEKHRERKARESAGLQVRRTTKIREETAGAKRRVQLQPKGFNAEFAFSLKQTKCQIAQACNYEIEWSSWELAVVLEQI